MKPVTPFQNRWLITGTLTTTAPLHIGNGGTGEIRNRSKLAKDEEHDANTVCTDHDGRAYIPATAVKGALRARIKSLGLWDKTWEALLGSDKPDAPDAVGGKLVFFDAFWNAGTDEPTIPADQRHSSADLIRPWWDNKRKTCVAVSVSLDRRTRTAGDQLLYHLEYVPAGESFRLEIGTENLDDEAAKDLLGLLESFNDPDHPVTLGGQASNGWGKLSWNADSARCLDDLAAWLARDAPPAGFKACTSIGQDRLATLAATPLAAPAKRLAIHLNLSMDSPWLVRDPRQRERSQEAKKHNVCETDKPADAVPVTDEQGRPFLPAKSLRGALRSRAEMILRTVDLDCADRPGKIPPVSTKGRSTEDALKKIAAADLAARLFGLSGWQAPIHVPRLTQEDAPANLHQEFVAIDRFTGGAADSAKFDAKLAAATTLKGTLTIDLDRLKKIDSDYASIGLLALVLRDLAEGDIPVGSGSAKGQGACSAEATVTHNGRTFASLADWFASDLVKDALAAFRTGIPKSPTP